jgi:hypothetical protein
MNTVPGRLIFESRTDYMQWLANYNRQKLSKIFDEAFMRRLEMRRVSASQCRKAHQEVENAIFVDSYFSRKGWNLCEVMRRDQKTFRRLTDNNVALALEGKKKRAEKLVKTGMVPILIRPEMYHLRLDIVEYLRIKGCVILGEYEKRIGFSQYWALYEHAFGDIVKEMHVRRRMFGYINKPAYLILAKALWDKNSFINADFMAKNLKGKAGFYEDGTIRGEVIFREVSSILDKGDPIEFFALDPLMEYVYNDDTVYEDGIASKLHANLHGIHLPERHEVKKDLSILLTAREMDELISIYSG